MTASMGSRVRIGRRSRASGMTPHVVSRVARSQRLGESDGGRNGGVVVGRLPGGGARQAAR